jgi:energy-coupling factor transporter ATP-binding protein EcfA2
MRLVAVYFINNKRLGKETLNFGGQYFYKINLVSDFTITIKREKNNSFIKEFYHRKISSLSAIIGQNGSGKTTILKHIKDINQRAFFIYEHENKTYLVHRKNSRIFELEEKFTSLLEIPFDENIYYNDRIFSELEEYDESRESDEALIKNISKIKYFYYSVLSNYNTRLNSIDDFIVKGHDNNIININNEIILRQINFLFNLDLIDKIKKVYHDFPSYDSLTIMLKDKFLDDFKIHDSEKFLKENTTKNDPPADYQSFFFELNQLHKNATSDQIRVFISLYYRFLYSFLIVSNYSIAKKIGNIDEEFLKAKKAIENNSTSVELFRNLILAFDTSLKFNSPNIEDSINSMISNIEKFVGIQSFKDIEFNHLKEFMQSYSQLIVMLENNFNEGKPKNLNFLIFKPNKHLSLGEESLLNFFSSIYDNKNADCDSIILLLDEPELGFHPEWKKKFINSIVNILPELYYEINKEISNIQIIFTSHDPLTLSDIANSNIIYLLKMNDNKLQIYNNDLAQKTFATNINELLSSSFFLNDELVGDFARKKIESIIIVINYFKLEIQKQNLINNSKIEQKSKDESLKKINLEIKILTDNHKIKISQEDFENEKASGDILKTINLIGEPVIRFKLLEMYEEVFIDNSKKIKAEKIKRLMEENGLTKDDL